MKKKDENIQVIPSKKKGSDELTIKLENELTIFSVENMKDKIFDAVKKYNNIKFELKNINNMDLTFVQLLYSVRKTAQELNKKVSFTAELSEDIKSLFDNTDLNKILM